MGLSKIFKGKNIRAVNKIDGTLKITLSGAPVPFAEKMCTRCHVTKQLNDFSVLAGGKYGRAAQCKVCSNIWHRGYYSGKKRTI